MADRATAGRMAKRHGREAELLMWRQLVTEGFHVVLGSSGKTRDEIMDAVAIGKNIVRLISCKYGQIYGRDREAELDALFPLARFPGVSRELWEYDAKSKAFTVSHV